MMTIEPVQGPGWIWIGQPDRVAIALDALPSFGRGGDKAAEFATIGGQTEWSGGPAGWPTIHHEAGLCGAQCRQHLQQALPVTVIEIAGKTNGNPNWS